MCIIGFVPNPEAAATVVAWVQALVNKDEETKYLCLESGFDGQTGQAVREAVNQKGGGVPTLVAIDDPMPIPQILDHARKRDVRLLVTAPFAMPSVSKKAQTSDQLMRSSPCQTFVPLFGGKDPSEVKKILFVATIGAHTRSALLLVDALRQRFRADVTIGAIEDETGAKAGKTAEKGIQALLHDAALDEEGFEIKVIVDRLFLSAVPQRFSPRGVATKVGCDAVM